MQIRLFFLAVLALAAALPAADLGADRAPDGPTSIESLLASFSPDARAQDVLSTGVQYRFLLSGADAASALVVSNSAGEAGAVRIYRDDAEGAAALRSWKVGRGETLTLTAAEIGWSATQETTVKLSPGLQGALRSNSGIVRLPGGQGVRSFEVFSPDRRPDSLATAGPSALIPLGSSSLVAAPVSIAPGKSAGPAPVAGVARPVVDIAFGSTLSGALQTTDSRVRGSATGPFADTYRFTVDTAQNISFEMRSVTVDSFLLAFDAESGELIGFNDDRGTGLNSRLELSLPPGTYEVEATSFDPGETGPYTVSLTSLGPLQPAVELTLGEDVEGVLEASDNRSVVGDGTYADYYLLEVTEPQTVTITLRSSAFDAYLILVGLNAQIVDEDDDSAGGFDALIEFAAEPGIYVIEAASFDFDETGPYTLSATGSLAGGPQITAEGVVSSASFLGGSVAPGEILSFFGVDIGPEELAGLEFGPDGKVATEIGATRILFDGEPAPMVFAVSSQASAVAPFALAGRSTTTVQIESDGRLSNPVTLTVTPTKPSIFSINQTGSGPGAVLNQDFSVNSAANPAAVGSAIQIFLSGGGQTAPASVDGELAPSSQPLSELLAPVSVTVGGVPATVVYSGGAPGLINGLVQVNAILGEGTPSGEAVLLVVTVGNAESQVGITIAVE